MILIFTTLLGVAWVITSRLFAPDSKLNKSDPVNAETRFDWLKACRDLAFFFILYVITATVIFFVAGAVVAIIAPPDPLAPGFVESFNKILGSISSDKGVLSPTGIIGAGLQLITVIIAVFVSQKVARGRFILDLGLRWYKSLPLDVLMGLFLAPILFALIMFIGQATGLIVGVNGPNFNWVQLILWLIIFLFAAIAEELVVRGYILQTLNQGFGGIAAVVGSSLFWGLVHLFNPNSTIVGAINVTFFGLIFAYAYYLTGHLWLPIAFHFSWNFSEGAIFGFPVSGIEMPEPILRPFVDAPEALMGGRFGPEGGMIGILAVFVAGVIIYGWARVRQPGKI